MKTRFWQALLISLGLGALQTASAIPITFNLQGSVDFAAESNAFGLSAGDSIFGTVFIPNALGVGFESCTPNQGLEVFFQIGTISFSSLDDIGFPDFPIVDLNDGQLELLDMEADNFAFSATFSTFFYPDWEAFDEQSLSVSGTLSATRVSTAVPEPGSLPLLIVGLLMALYPAVRLRRATWG